MMPSWFVGWLVGMVGAAALTVGIYLAVPSINSAAIFFIGVGLGTIGPLVGVAALNR